MARLTTYASLYGLMHRELPGIVNTGIFLEALKWAGRDFCRETESWQEDLDPILMTDWQAEYRLTHEYDAEIQRVECVLVDAQSYAGHRWSLFEADHLRFGRQYTPHSLDEKLLVCGACGETDYSNWTGITDGSVTLEVFDSTYSVEDLDFSSALSMDDVASVIQTGLRAAMESSHPYVRYGNDDKFRVWVETAGEVGYLTAGASGTDISGTSYMNGLSSAGTLGGLLQVRVVFRPHIRIDGLPAWFLDRWADGIVAGAVMHLAAEPKAPYTDVDVARRNTAMYYDQINAAKVENDLDYKDDYVGLPA